VPSEADTCRKLVVPLLQAAGWDSEPHSIAEQRTVTDGRIVPVGKGFIRKPPKRVDYLLRYRRDFPLAVVEAKAAYKHAADGLQQAKHYAEMLGLKFAYATNGHDILEFDYTTGLELTRTDYPAPDELWQRYRTAAGIRDQAVADRLLTPFNHDVGKGERYYAQIAVNRTMEAILKGQRRLLLTMATGTGKTVVAFQLCWKLWSSRWNRTGEFRKPRILYLADRNILVDQPKDGIFAAFGDARYKIESGEVVHSREMYFAIYQALAEDERRVVARIEELAGKIAEATTLRQQSVELVQVLCRSILSHDASAVPTPMHELVRLRPPDVEVRRDEMYQFAGVYSFGRGVFRTGRKSGFDFAYPRLTRLKAGNFVYPKLMAWEGALGVVPEACDGCVVSTEFPVFHVLEERVLPEVLDIYFRTPSVWPAMSGASTGTNVRRRRLNPQDFLAYKMPLPSRSTQECLRQVMKALTPVHHLQAETAFELHPLLPAILDRAFKGELV
jgi:hypothetical protein